MLKRHGIGNSHVEHVINHVSEDENEENGNPDMSSGHLSSELEEYYRLREEDDILRCQVQALKNELIEMQATHEVDMARKNRIYSELLIMKASIDESTKALLHLSQNRSKERKKTVSGNPPVSKRKRESDGIQTNDGTEFGQGTGASTSASTSNAAKEARLTSLISIFLHVLPFGANIDCICSYLNDIVPDVKSEDVENVLKRYPSIFKQNSNGIGGSLSENWRFVTFQE